MVAIMIYGPAFLLSLFAVCFLIFAFAIREHDEAEKVALLPFLFCGLAVIWISAAWIYIALESGEFLSKKLPVLFKNMLLHPIHWLVVSPAIFSIPVRQWIKWS
ncbi:MAG: hypothetical protein AAGE65_02215 [Planctomycetota bacterium]